MRKSKSSDSQIMDIVRRAEAFIGVYGICQELGISTATLYISLAKYGGKDVSILSLMKELEKVNRRRKKMHLMEQINNYKIFHKVTLKYKNKCTYNIIQKNNSSI